MQATITRARPFDVLSRAFTQTARRTGDFFLSICENNARIRRVERLSAMSDAELAERGLKRDEIVRYVFRDVLYL